jgi:O-acetyl-ADP-ribose deacetylase (regulator of RNase III)
MNAEIAIVRGDITKLEVDAIVNAANATLLGGGGVDGAIHRAAGPDLLAECRRLGGCQPGEAKLTRGHRLPAPFVIHTVGPVWRGGKSGEADTLANCYRNSLKLAVENGIRTVAFPAISCGAYGYPIKEAAQIAVKTTGEFLATTDVIEKVIFVLWSEDVYEAYHRLL